MSSEGRKLVRWQRVTLALMVVGYAGYYLCRSNLSVTLPLILDDLEAAGADRDRAKIGLGSAASLGVFAYALGKFASGALADFFGGRRNFLFGMAGAVVFTALFSVGGGMPLFTLAWIGNRAVQSLGWVGMVKIASRWFSHSHYASVMGIVSLSFLFGDAAARTFMGGLIALGLGWRGVFGVAAATLAIIAIVSTWLLRESPRDRGLPEPDAGTGTLFGAGGSQPHPPGLAELLAPFLRSPSFWVACLLSFGFTLLREAFNTWTPTYFTEQLGLADDVAAAASAWFPLLGGVSVLIAGFLGDRIGRVGRALLMLFGLLGSAGTLLALAQTPARGEVAIALVALTGFLIIGPYSYLAGAVSLDFGGKQGSATACGIIDGVGYLGGILAGEGIARVAVGSGWGGVFAVLAGVAAVTCAVAVGFVALERRAAAAAGLPSEGPTEGPG